MKRCLQCAYPLDYLASDVCPECGRQFLPRNPFTYCDDEAPHRAPLRIGMIAVLLTWPPVALGYAFFLSAMEGIWGDPWYGAALPPYTLSSIRDIAFYPVGGAVVIVACAVWFVLAVYVTRRRGRFRSTRRPWMLVPAWCIGPTLILWSALILDDVLRSFLTEAFRP